MISNTQQHWQARSTTETADLLHTDIEKGLSAEEAASRLDEYGPNAISGKRARTKLEQFLSQFHQPLVYILIAAGVVTGLLGEWVDCVVIMGVVLVNAVVGYVQELKAVRALNSLAASMSVEAVVLRGGRHQRLQARDVVPGDVVVLRSGDKVPADVRLVRAREFRVDESALTGESLPVEKTVDSVDEDSVLAERTCMAYAGTMVSYGQARGIVVETGNRTEIGRISGMIDAAEELETPLTRKISKFSHVLLVAILALAAASFVLGLLRSEPLGEMFMAAVALAVGAIPEGLPAAVTIILALGVGRMARRKAVIRKLPAVETLGGTTVICSDKTGTLTENQMTVQEIFCHGGTYDVSGTGYEPVGEIVPRGAAPASEENAALRHSLRAGLLCNDAQLFEKDERTLVEGDPTEGAFLVAAAKFGLDQEEELLRAPRVDELPFESEWRYMVTVHEEDGTRVAYMKGAVERVLDCCRRTMQADGTYGELDADEVVEHQLDMAARGLRVLALARKELEPGQEVSREASCVGMDFLGLQGMIDPPREEAKQAVAVCRRAGVRVKMITGDHAVTAQAIGKMLGMRGGDCSVEGHCPVKTGREIAALSDEELIPVAQEVAVFARVSPEQKLRLVTALQARGEICAMTGDGVNDAPALKQADIGIAMGRSGTDAAKDAADMILTDDNFATIAAAVEEGRGVFANLVKFIAWTLPTNAGEGLVILTAILFGVTLPITPLQILWINMTTAGSLGMMLAFEPREPGIMDRPPRRPDRPILDKVLLRRVALVSVMLLVLAFGVFKLELLAGASLEKARTMAVNVFVMVEAFYLLNARSFVRSPMQLGLLTNPWVLGGMAGMLVLQLVFTYAPFMHTLFSSASIGVLDWLKLLVGGVGVFLVVEWDKKRVGGDV